MFQSSTVCVITGASRGLGRAIAESFAREVSKHEAKSTVILTARSQDGLQETSQLMNAVCSSGNLEVHCVRGDLSDMDSLEKTTRAILDKVDAKCFSTAVLFNNAGTLGDLSKLITEQNLQDIRSYWDTNISSFMYLTSSFVTKFQPSCKVYVVNISSTCALKPVKSMGLYCTGKAARHMAIRMLAAENPEVRVLSYHPGAMDTAMADEIMNTSVDPGLVNHFRNKIQQGTIVKPEVTASKLLNLLVEDTFENGAHIEVYSLIS